MPQKPGNHPVASASPFMVILAFAAIYIIWGSTYFFIRIAVQEIPPFILGTFRFMCSGLLLLGWSASRGNNVFEWKIIKPAAVGGILMLFIGTGVVLWVEQYLESALVAILVSSAPLWFVIMDTRKWKYNFSSRSIITGLIIGFTGVVLLFYEKIAGSASNSNDLTGIISLFLLLAGSCAWTGGSLYSKYNSPKASTQVTTSWQMIAAGVSFLVVLPFTNEAGSFQMTSVSMGAWMATLYLVIFGSIVAFSAYVWLLEVRPAAQVSTYGYVNPVVAVFLGMFFAGEKVSVMQVAGLAVILGSVLLINLSTMNQKISR